VRPEAIGIIESGEPQIQAEANLRGSPMAGNNEKSFLHAFWDFLVLFFGISTASNLERTQGRGLRKRGMFLIRTPRDK
jgi:hypothetical protein